MRRAREDLGLSRKDVGSAVGATPATVGRWERGQSSLQERFRKPLADLLGLDVSQLLRLVRSPIELGPTNVVSLSRTPDPPSEAPSSPGALPESSNSALRERGLAALINGLEQGHATNESWVQTARTVTRALGIPWSSGPEDGPGR